jgi:hypothetical protein
MTAPDNPGGTERLPPRYGEGGAAFVIGSAAPAAEEAATGNGQATATGTATVAPTVARAGTARSAAATAAGTAVVSYPLPRPAAAPAPAAPPVAVVPDGPPPSGTVYSSRLVDEGAPVRVRRMHRLRIGSHVASPAALTTFGVASPGSGLILGADRDRQPVPVRFFRPEPTKIAMVGEVWVAQLLAFRALALGARIVVSTVDPGLWDGFGRWATGRDDRVAVVAGERPLALSATGHQPVLVIYDLGTTGPSVPSALGPWHTQLTLLRQLSPDGLAVVQGSHLVMLKRLSTGEATLSAAPLRLSEHSVQLLQMMEDDMIALLGGGADRYVWLTLTKVEQQFAGRSRR